MGLVTIADLHNQPSDQVASYMSWASDLGALYEDFIRKDDDDVSFVAGWHGAKHRSQGIHASEMSGECRRNVWYSLTGEQRHDNDLDPFWKKRFRIGHMYHAMIQEDWRRLCEKSAGFLSFEKEVRISPKLQVVAEQYGIQSSCDGVIGFHDHPWGATTMRVGLEIKTKSPAEYEKLTTKGPDAEHLRQTCVYMKCLDVPLLWTMYVNKGNQNVVPSVSPYLFMFDAPLWDVIEGETKEVIHLATINEPPPRVESICCQFCGYSWTCQPECLARQEKKKQYLKEKATREKRLKRHGGGGMRVPRTATK